MVSRNTPRCFGWPCTESKRSVVELPLRASMGHSQMSPDSPSALGPVAAQPSRLDWVRLVIALIITTALLPYGWGRVVVSTMIDWPEPGYRIAVALGFLVVMALTWKLGRRFENLQQPAAHLWLGRLDLLLLVVWLVESAMLINLMVGPGLPAWCVIALFAPSMLWVPWLTWWPFRSGWERLPGLLILGLLGALFPALIEVKGVTGEIKLEFAWRDRSGKTPVTAASQTDANSGSVQKPAAETPATIELPPVGPHDFSQFLGPQRTGVVTGSSLARDWKSDPPRERWRVPVGLGWSSFAVVGDACFTQEQAGSGECVVCRRVSDGREVWRHADRERFNSVMGGDGPRATPTVADGLVYAIGAKGRLNCLQGSDGSVVWSIDILKENQASENVHGVCGSPLIYEDLVIVAPTRTRTVVLAAYDRKNCRPVWQAKGEGEASYASPMIARLAGRTVLLYQNAAELAAYDPATGERLWQFPWTNDVRVNSSQCIVLPGTPDRIVVSTGYSVGAALFEVTCDESSTAAGGDWKVIEKWRSRGMKTKFTTPVAHGSAIYGLDDGILAAIDIETGKQLWKSGRYGHGQILLAGDVLLVQAETGEVVLVDPQPARLVELGRIPALSGKTWNNLALAHDLLLVRNDHEAACYQLPLAKER